MKGRSRSIVILSILFGYILLQFLWWEVLLVRQNNQIIKGKQNLAALSVTDEKRMRLEVEELERKKRMQTLMITGEGTVFLLLLLFGLYKIKQAMDKETALNQQQKNFFLSITHELKTPIAANRLQLQTLQKQKLDEETRQQLLKSALNENDRLNALIDNILFANRLESNEFLFKPERTELVSFCSEILHRYYQRETENGELELRLTGSLYLKVDQQSFPSVITNLVDNALKYSGSQPRVSVGLSAHNGNAVLEVEDNGPGIPEKEKEAVFRRFYRVGSEETRRSKGTGLGLYIVNYIVARHRGSIDILDRSPQGSVFRITIPIVQ